MLSKYLTKVVCVTESYVGVPTGPGGQVILVHKSQVEGTPKVGDWIEAYGFDEDTKLKRPC
jgi:hypothetical protein